MNSNLGTYIANNSFSNIDGFGIIFSQNTNILQNSFKDICRIGGATCAAIQNNTTLPSGTSLSGSISENSIENV